MQRHTRANPCQVCQGYQEAEHGIGKRCWGFLSSDGTHDYCTRDEHAGNLQINPNASAYAHKLEGRCNCGQPHGVWIEPSIQEREMSKTREHHSLIGDLEAWYDYRNLDGELVFQVVRYANPKSFRQRVPVVARPNPHDKYHWSWNMEGVERIPYRLGDWKKDPIYFVEGEKSADLLTNLGLSATCTSGGAGKWSLGKYAPYFTGHAVYLLPDNDAVGIAHMREVADALTESLEVKIVRLPGLDPKADVYDWLKDNTVDDLHTYCMVTPGHTAPPRDCRVCGDTKDLRDAYGHWRCSVCEPESAVEQSLRLDVEKRLEARKEKKNNLERAERDDYHRDVA